MKAIRYLTLGLALIIGLTSSQEAAAQRAPGGKRKPWLSSGCGACLKKGVFRASPVPNGGPGLNAIAEANIPKGLEITRTSQVFRSVGSLPFAPVLTFEGFEVPTQFIPLAPDPGLVHESSVDPMTDLLPVWVEVEVQTGMLADASAGDAVGAAYVVWVEEDSDNDGVFECLTDDSCGYLAQNPGFYGTVAWDGTSTADGFFRSQAYPSLRHYFRATRKRHRVRVDGTCSNFLGPAAAGAGSGCVFDYSLLKVSSGVAAP